ncbi:MAG: LPS-assembly protein LptD, partial [Oceanospirillales bacterium]
MPFKKNSAYKLSLAIATILCAPFVLSQQDNNAWVCDVLPNGEWDCKISDVIIEAPEIEASVIEPSVIEAPETAPVEVTRPTEMPETMQATEPASVVANEPVSSETTISTESVTTETPQLTETPVSTPAVSSPVDTRAVSSPNDSPAPRTAQSSTQSNNLGRAQSASAWDCSTGSDGNWSCAPGNQQGVSVAQVGRFNTPTAGASGLLLNNPYAHLDWFPNRGTEPMLCPGGYIEPEIAYLEPNIEVGNEAVYAEADLSSADLQGGLARLTGGVIIQQANRLFTSGYGEVDNNAGTAFLENAVTFREPGLLLIGNRAETDFNTGVSSFYSAEFVMHAEHLRGSAEKITRFDDQRVTFSSGSVTYCEPGNNAWAIASSDITLYPDKGYGTAKHMTFRVADVPVFYLPWFRFPIDDTRQSGFLYPSMGISKSDGVDVSIPYYFNIAPNIDDTLTVRHIEKRGLLFENELRYMNEWSTNELSLGYLSGDKKSDGENRWLTGLTHRGTPADRWTSQIDYTKVGDDDYFSDLGTSLEVKRADHLDQRGQLRYQGDGWNFLANLHQYQTINDNISSPYQKSPQLLLTGNERVNNRTNLDYQAEYVRFTRDRKDFFTRDDLLINRTEAQRLHLRPTISHQNSRPWGFLNGAATLWHSSYDFSFPEIPPKDNVTNLIPNSVTAGIASIDSGLYFDRDFEFASNSYSQSLEPRLMLLHVEKNNEQPTPEQFRYFDSSQLSFSYNNLFDRYGWSGNDRVSATSQATIGASSAIYNERGAEQARLAVAQAYYFSDRELNDLRPGDISGTESSSNIALLAQWNITPSLRLRHDSEIDRDDFSLEEQNYQLTWRPDDENLFYFSYRDRINSASNAARTRQSDIAFRNQINPQWATIGRWQHDIVNRQRLDTVLGLEYGTCCWKMRLTAREWLTTSNLRGSEAEYDRGVFLQFVLRGLGS